MASEEEPLTDEDRDPSSHTWWHSTCECQGQPQNTAQSQGPHAKHHASNMWSLLLVHQGPLPPQFHKHLPPARCCARIISILYNFYKLGVIVPTINMEGAGTHVLHMVSTRARFCTRLPLLVLPQTAESLENGRWLRLSTCRNLLIET